MPSRTIYLSRLIGLAILVLSVTMLVNKPQAMETVTALFQDRAVLFVLGFIASTAGLALIVGHQIWRGVLPIVVTVLGWLFLLRGVVLLVLSPANVARLLAWFGFESRFYAYLGGTAAFGLYLALHGFTAHRAKG